MRPYRHYSDTDLFKRASDLEATADQDAYFIKQLALVEAEIAEREFEHEYLRYRYPERIRVRLPLGQTGISVVLRLGRKL